jgi:hypothetical protein
VQVGDLIYDDHYGNGVVFAEGNGVMKVFFAEVNQVCWMDKEMTGDSVEVVSASR